MRSIDIPQCRMVEVWDQNWHGSESNLDQNYKGGNERPMIMPQNITIRDRDQNVYGPKSSIDHMYERGNLRLVAMPLGRNQIVLSPSRDIDGDLPRDN